MLNIGFVYILGIPNCINYYILLKLGILNIIYRYTTVYPSLLLFLLRPRSVRNVNRSGGTISQIYSKYIMGMLYCQEEIIR